MHIGLFVEETGDFEDEIALTYTYSHLNDLVKQSHILTTFT